MKASAIYRVYITDTDGSERLGCTVSAKSVRHAKVLAKAQPLGDSKSSFVPSCQF